MAGKAFPLCTQGGTIYLPNSTPHYNLPPFNNHNLSHNLTDPHDIQSLLLHGYIIPSDVYIV